MWCHENTTDKVLNQCFFPCFPNYGLLPKNRSPITVSRKLGSENKEKVKLRITMFLMEIASKCPTCHMLIYFLSLPNECMLLVCNKFSVNITTICIQIHSISCFIKNLFVEYFCVHPFCQDNYSFNNDEIFLLIQFTSWWKTPGIWWSPLRRCVSPLDTECRSRSPGGSCCRTKPSLLEATRTNRWSQLKDNYEC